jgi:hypothetical protein
MSANAPLRSETDLEIDPTCLDTEKTSIALPEETSGRSADTTISLTKELTGETTPGFMTVNPSTDPTTPPRDKPTDPDREATERPREATPPSLRSTTDETPTKDMSTMATREGTTETGPTRGDPLPTTRWQNGSILIDTLTPSLPPETMGQSQS